MENTEDFIPISALQHYLYCPRQCALIHLERLWSENKQTAEGRLLHDKADTPLTENRHGVRTVTAMPISHSHLGINGVADVVEFLTEGDKQWPYPVEYKRGRPKAHRADEVQLCAQALCLEFMFDCSVHEGALFYGKTRRRQPITFDSELRKLTIETIHAVRQMLQDRQTPKVGYQAKRCDACSLLEPCQPKLISKGGNVDDWLLRQIEEAP